MSEAITILTVSKDGQDGVVIAFSDGTVAGYVVEELIELRPEREKVTPIPLISTIETERPMQEETVFFDLVPQPDGSKRYAVRIDPIKITDGYAEEEFWRLMVHCFGAVDQTRTSFIALLEAKGSLVQRHWLTPQCWSRIDRSS